MFLRFPPLTGPHGAPGAPAHVSHPPPHYHAGLDALAELHRPNRHGAPSVPAALLAALSGPAAQGTLGAVSMPLAFDPLVYVAVSRHVGEVAYVGRSHDLPERMARHRRALAEAGAWWPDLWAWARVPAPDAPAVEEGLIRLLQAAGHPAHHIRRRSPTAGGRLVTGRQEEALRAHGFLDGFAGAPPLG